jgi:hypothetical protein
VTQLAHRLLLLLLLLLLLPLVLGLGVLPSHGAAGVQAWSM